jgi:hypothetical protein
MHIPGVLRCGIATCKMSTCTFRDEKSHHQSTCVLVLQGTRSLVVKALDYKPEGRGFETQVKF